MLDDGDSVTEVTHQSWFGRLGSALKGIVVGTVLVIAAVVLLSWNEGRAVDRSRALASGAAAVVPAAVDRVDPANEGRLLHVAGTATTTDRLADPIFGIAVTALRLERTVEMYQWREETSSETREKLGGGTETVTTYRYTRSWDSRLADSSRFKQPEGHRNPATMPLASESWQAGNVTLGAFRLSEGLVSRIDRSRPLALADHTARLPAAMAGRPVAVHGEELYLGQDPAAPQVGDLRVRFAVVEPTAVSVVSQQYGDGFVPFATPTGEVELLEQGIVPADAMFRTAEQENTLLTWALRLVGFVVMTIGLRAALSILAVAASVIPLLGQVVGAGLSLIAGTLALALSLVVVALAWIAQRPVLGIGLLVAGAAVAVGLVVLRRRGVAPPAGPVRS